MPQGFEAHGCFTAPCVIWPPARCFLPRRELSRRTRRNSHPGADKNGGPGVPFDRCSLSWVLHLLVMFSCRIRTLCARTGPETAHQQHDRRALGGIGKGINMGRGRRTGVRADILQLIHGEKLRQGRSQAHRTALHPGGSDSSVQIVRSTAGWPRSGGRRSNDDCRTGAMGWAKPVARTSPKASASRSGCAPPSEAIDNTEKAQSPLP